MTKARDLANASTALSAVSATELGYLDGVTSAVQTQVDAKLASSTAATTYVANALADAKGDIFVASADNTVTRLPVGSTGDTIVADSSTATGLKWAAPSAGSSNVAGKNGVLNSNFSVWQRGTSISLAANAGITYLADRWATQTAANQACTVSRQATGDTTNLPFIQYALRYQRNSGQTGTDALSIIQPFESVNSIPFAGKTVTFSFYARAGANFSAASSLLYYLVRTGTGTDQMPFNAYTGGSTSFSAAVTLTTTWQRFTASATIPTDATEIAPQFYFIPVGTAGANDYYEVTGVQLETASSATAYSPNAGTFQGELAACQRYFWRQGTGGTKSLAMVAYQSSTLPIGTVQFPVEMRVAPSFSYVSGSGYYAVQAGNTDVTFADVGSAVTSNSSSRIYATTNTGTSTTGWAGDLRTSNAAALVSWSAEL